MPAAKENFMLALGWQFREIIALIQERIDYAGPGRS
jgi:hypothetical protein